MRFDSIKFNEIGLDLRTQPPAIRNVKPSNFKQADSLWPDQELLSFCLPDSWPTKNVFQFWIKVVAVSR